MAAGQEEQLTVDQMISKLQNLSWTGKGSYKLFGVGNHKERFHTKSDLGVDDQKQLVDLTPNGAYVP